MRRKKIIKLRQSSLRPNANKDKGMYIMDIGQAHMVKMAGYLPSSFFVCLWKEMELGSVNIQKRTRLISCHLAQTSLVNKGFIILGKKNTFLAGHSR